MHRVLRPFGGAAVIVPVAVASAAVGAMVLAGVVINRIPFAHHLPVEFWVLAVLAVVADVWPLPVPGANRRFATVFLSFCFTFAITLLWGPIFAVAVQTVAVAGAALRLRFTVSWLVFTITRLAAAFGAAGVVLELFGPPPLTLGVQVDRLEVFAVVAAAVTWFTVSYAILAVWLRTHNHHRWRRSFSRTVGNELLSAGALFLLAPVFVGAPTAWASLFVLLPVFAVSQLARLSAEREEQLRHDSLTCLLGRQGLLAEIEDLADTDAAPVGSVRTGRFALLLLDLDRFKNVNDALGHAVGDRLLIEVGRRLVGTVPPGNMVARLGGDEFAVLVPDVTSVSAARESAGEIASALAVPARVDGLPLDVSASIGVALYPDHGQDASTLLRHADVAMYAAKRAAEAVAVYTPQADSNSPERLGLLADLRRALQDPGRRAEIRFHYQPQVAIATGEVVGLEALLRWHHPELGLVNTEEVVWVAENSGVMQLLTRRAFDDVVGQLASWNAVGLRMSVSINVSVRDLHTTELVDHLDELLRCYGVQPGQVELEMTETALMADPRPVLATVEHLARLGIGLALDDIGTGYSSLLHLRRLPLTEVKVDRSFVRAMAGSRDDEAIVRSVIELARALGLRVVAEGVEDERTHQMLAAVGCDIGQGWHYAADMPHDELRTWLAHHTRPQLAITPQDGPPDRARPSPGSGAGVAAATIRRPGPPRPSGTVAG